jgi:hypothetical protein
MLISRGKYWSTKTVKKKRCCSGCVTMCFTGIHLTKNEHQNENCCYRQQINNDSRRQVTIVHVYLYCAVHTNQWSDAHHIYWSHIDVSASNHSIVSWIDGDNQCSLDGQVLEKKWEEHDHPLFIFHRLSWFTETLVPIDIVSLVRVRVCFTCGINYCSIYAVWSSLISCTRIQKQVLIKDATHLKKDKFQ